MQEWSMIEDRREDELTSQAPGTTVVLSAEGWEEADYAEPGDDWRLLGDGSYLSPDGTIRSWPLVGPDQE
ncbi:MAG TPA: hypothetical protein VGB34_05805 [Candidatus Limnocylindria bacterium]